MIKEAALSDYWKKLIKEKLRINNNVEDLQFSEQEMQQKFKYYIHFDGENRRLDKWVAESELYRDTKKVDQALA